MDPMGGGEQLPESSKLGLVEEFKSRAILNAYLAFKDGEAAGVCVTIDSFSTFACKPVLNIHDFAVTSKFRRQGVAKAMLGYVCDRARENGMAKVSLEVLQNNTPAKGCYRALGFEPYVLDAAMGQAEFWSKKL